MFTLFVLPTGILLGWLTGINIFFTVGAVLLVTVLALLIARFLDRTSCESAYCRRAWRRSQGLRAIPWCF